MMMPSFRSGLVEEIAHLPELLITLFENLVRRYGRELFEGGTESFPERGNRGLRIEMCAAGRFRNDAIDQLELQQVSGGQAQSCGREWRLSGITPDDRGATLRRDHAIVRVLEHVNPIRHSQRQSTATASFSDDHRDDRSLESRH